MISHELSGRYFQLENPESIGIVYIVWQCFLLLKLLIKFHFKFSVQPEARLIIFNYEFRSSLDLFSSPMALETCSG